ncbi:eukaryotic translation initiation factor 4 gamma 1-like isoform X2 [Montipora capricornis]|uniref:eukaryotic translation initiation factor 4 gamma 1-like isoform X2 n=1 Tax=Montipora capricornis TaxID=246305 RepID=UPI0035F1956D
MKKKKQKHRLREMEKRSSEKETDMVEAYTEKPVQQETPDEGEEQPAEETTESQQEVQVTEDVQSDDDPWEIKEVPPRDMKKKKQKHRLREMEKRSSEKETDMMEAYTEKPVQQELKRVDNRWVRPSEASKSGNEEETKTEELYRKVRSILNKLTPQKFQTLTQQISELEIDTPERLEGAIDLIFEKAIDEANFEFSVAYANMCKCLLNKKVVVEKEGVKRDVSFRTILLNKCQKEFEREKSVEKTIHEKLEDLTKQGLSEEELQSRKRDLQDEERQQKRRTLGNIRFIGELFKLKMLTESIMHDCVVKLLKSNDEESFERLCKLLVTIGKDLDHEKAKPRVDQYFAHINKIISARKTSSRVRFMMQDIVDLRSNGWVPRREDNNPKTIDQIHREAANQAKKTQMAIQIARQDKRLQQRGNTGGRGSPRPGAIPQADESWTTVGRGPRNVSVDLKKFQNIRRPVDSKNISLGSGGRDYGAWARRSSGGSGTVGAGAGPSAAASAGSSIAGVSAETDNRPANNRPANRYSAVEAVRAAMQRKRASQDRGSGRESPRTTAEVAPATDSGAGSAALAASQEVTQELMKKKSLSIIDEFLNIRDMREVAECLKELQSPSRHHVFVEVTFNHTMEKRASERQATGKLIHFLMRDGVLTAQHYLNGLESIFAVAEDTEIDLPQLWKYLGELMGPTAFDGNLGLDELFKCVFKYVSKHKAARLFACILQSNEKSPQEVRALLDTCNVTVYTFFDDADEAREFAKDKNIEYALGPSPASSHITGSTSAHSANVEEQLRTVILKRKARNEEVMDWIDDERIGSGTGEWKGGQFFVCSKDFRGEIALQEPQEKELQQENLERQLVVLQQQLREKEQCLANYRAQLEERNLTETNLIQQLQQQEHQQENSQRQLQEMEEQIRENKDDKANLEKQLEVLQQQLSENQQCLTIYRAQLEERNLRETRLIRQLQEKELQGENSQRLLQEMEEQIREKEDDKANSERQLREMVQSFEERIRGKEEQKTNLETQLGMKNQQLREIETSLSAAQQMIIELRRQESCDWAISRDEIQVKDKYLGKGAWGSVNEATYCGCIVAVKQIHELILSPHNRRLFEREMNIASRCRHPCLLQFIGATNDEGSPLFVTELMELSLRALLEKRQLTETEISVISLDVSRALNYLHHMKPSPIVHRDVSSANVLLWRQGEQWRGKVSDYGTAKFVQQTMTVAPGALIYSAPEAVSSNQTSKVDVYSFGVLLCEMCIREMPDPERREEQVLVVKNRNFRNLVRQCLEADPAMRPDMAQIIQELEQG